MRTGGQVTPARAYPAMAYDAITGQIVLFGGGVSSGTAAGDNNPLSDTWISARTL